MGQLADRRAAAIVALKVWWLAGSVAHALWCGVAHAVWHAVANVVWWRAITHTLAIRRSLADRSLAMVASLAVTAGPSVHV